MSKSSPAGCAKPRPSAPPWLLAEVEPNRVLTDGDQVAIGQLLLDHGLAVYERAVGAAEVTDPERARANFDTAVPARGGGIPDHDVVVRRTSHRHHLIRQGDDPAGKGAALEAELGRDPLPRRYGLLRLGL